MQTTSPLLSLLQLTDPTLPIGGFAHSFGLETYVQNGMVHDLLTAEAFIQSMLSNNFFYTDGALMSLAFDAAVANDLEKIVALDIECSAVKTARETREASNKLGLRLIKIFSKLVQSNPASDYAKAVKMQNASGHYCIAFGIFAQALNLTKTDALTSFYYNASVGMVTNCVKLIPLGQQDGQELLFSLHQLITTLVNASLHPDRNLIGLCCNGFDIRCMQHEQLYSRLYMS